MEYDINDYVFFHIRGDMSSSTESAVLHMFLQWPTKDKLNTGSKESLSDHRRGG